jgi:hypothetical protein
MGLFGINLARNPKELTPVGAPAAIKKEFGGKPQAPEQDMMNPEAHASFNQAQEGLTKEAPQIENEAMSTVDSNLPIGSDLRAQAKPMAFGGPETSQALENMAQNRYKDDIQKLRIKTRDESRKIAAQNQAKAFENLIEKNKLAQQAHARRMDRKQARYAARMAVVSTAMQAAGMIVGGAAGASAGGAVGPKPGAAPTAAPAATSQGGV